MAFAILVSVVSLGFFGLDDFAGIFAVALGVFESNAGELAERVLQDFEGEELDELDLADFVAVLPVAVGFGDIDVNDVIAVLLRADERHSGGELRVAFERVRVLVRRRPDARTGDDDFDVRDGGELLGDDVIHMRDEANDRNRSV